MKTSHISQVLTKYQSKDIKIKEEIKDDMFLFGASGQFEIDIASSLETKTKAYQLVYDIYRLPDIDYAEEHPSKMWYSLYNANPSTITLIVRNNILNKIVATLTIVLDTELGLPMKESYPRQIENLRAKKKRCAEIISLGFDKSALGSCEILVQLFKFSYLITRNIYHATDFLIMIKPRHASFYEKKLCFEKIGDEVICKKIKNRPVALYQLNLIEAEKKAQWELDSDTLELKHNKGIFKSFVEAQNCDLLMNKLREKVIKSEMTINDLEYLFIESRDIFQENTTEKVFNISKMYKNKNTQEFLIRCAYDYCNEGIDSGFYACV